MEDLITARPEPCLETDPSTAKNLHSPFICSATGRARILARIADGFLLLFRMKHQLRLRRYILPVSVLGNCSTQSIRRGNL